MSTKLKWVQLAGTNERYSHVSPLRIGKINAEFSERATGWAVNAGVAGVWWAMHPPLPPIGPFDTMEEAKNYVEVTYALEE